MLTFVISIPITTQPSPQRCSSSLPTFKTHVSLFSFCLSQQKVSSDHASLVKKDPNALTSESPDIFTIRKVALSEVEQVADMCSGIFAEAEGEWATKSFFGGPIPFLSLLRHVRRRLMRDESRSHLLRRVWKMWEGGTGSTHKVFVAEHIPNGELCGCVEVGIMVIGSSTGYDGKEEKKAYVGNLAVKNNWRRKGLGSKLTTACHQVAREWGFEDVFLHVDDGNEAATQFYGRLGYTCESQEPEWYSSIGRTRKLLLRKSFVQKGRGKQRSVNYAEEWKKAPVVESQSLNAFELLLYCIYDLKRGDK